MPDAPRAVLEQLPVSEVWGVRSRLSARLEKQGIRTAWQLACADTGDIRRKFSVILAKTVLELRGESVIEHEDPDAPPQSISHSRTFGAPVTEFDDLVESVCTYTAKAAEKLRKERQRAAGVNILESEENRQIDLFADTASEEKDDRLSKALDAINSRYGRGDDLPFVRGDQEAVADEA